MTDDIDKDYPDTQGDWRTPADRARDIAQAKALREQASKGGLRFDVFLPSGLAEWVLDFVERGVFVDPAEAVFVILGEHKNLEPHNDLRAEILKRFLDASVNDPRPPVPLDPPDPPPAVPGRQIRRIRQRTRRG